MARERFSQAVLGMTTQGFEQSGQQAGKFGKQVDQAGKYVNAAQKSLGLFTAALVTGRIGQLLDNIGRRMVDFSKRSLELAKSWETGMRLVRTQTDLTAKQFGNINSEVLDVAKRMPFALESVSDSMYDIYSGTRLVGEEGPKLLKMVTEAAVAGGADISTAVDSVVGAMNNFSLGIQDVPRLLDLQFKLVTQAKGRYEDFANALNNAYPSAVRFGQSLEETFAAVAMASRGAPSAAAAVTSVGRAFDQLSRSDVSQRMEEFGVAVFDAAGQTRPFSDVIEDLGGHMEHLTDRERQAAMREIFGRGSIQAMRFLNRVIPGFRELREEVESFEDAAGSMRRAFEIMMQDPATRIQILGNAFSVLRITMTERLFPALMTGVDFLERMIEAFDRLPESLQNTVTYFLVFGGVVTMTAGRVLRMISMLIGLQSLLILSGQSGRGFGRVLTAITIPAMAKWLVIAGLVAGAAALIIANWDRVTDFIERHKVLVIAAMTLISTVLLTKMIPAITATVTWWGILAVSTGADWLAAVGNFVKGAAMTVTSLTKIRVAIMAVYTTLGPLVAVVGAFVAAWGIFRSVTRDVSAEMLDIRRDLGDLTSQLDAGAITVTEFTLRVEEMRESLEPSFWDQVLSALSRVPMRYGLLTDKVAELREKQDEVTEALKRARPTEVDRVKNLELMARAHFDAKEAVDAHGNAIDTAASQVATFADMTQEATAEWLEGTRSNFASMEGALDSLVDKNTMSAERIIKAMRRTIEAQIDFRKNWKTVIDRAGGDADGFLKHIQETYGEKAAVFIAALADANDKEFKRILRMWQHSQDISDDVSEAIVGHRQDEAEATEDMATRALASFSDAQQSMRTFGSRSDDLLIAFRTSMREKGISPMENFMATAGELNAMKIRPDTQGLINFAGQVQNGINKMEGFMGTAGELGGLNIAPKFDTSAGDWPFGVGAMGAGGGRAAAMARSAMAAVSGSQAISSGYRSPEHNRRVGGSPTSLHMDAANPAQDIVGANLLGVARYLLARFGRSLRELIYTPLGFSVKHGAIVPPVAASSHLTHVHVADFGARVRGPALVKIGNITEDVQFTPRTGPGAAPSTFHYEPHFYNSRVDAKEAIDELEWSRRTSPWSQL